MAGYIGTGAVPQATQKRDSFTATAGQTSFPTSGYTPGYVDVYMNGVKLAPADFTATNSSDVVLAVAAVANDTLEIISYSTFDVSAQTFTGDVTASGGTFLPTGDTSAGDVAAMGYAAADGLVLTGQGSTSDVTIKNDADATVISIPTGTTGVTFAGTPTFPDGSINIADLDIDGGTDIGAALVDADLMVVDDGAGGTNRKATMSRLATYMGTKIGGMHEFINETTVSDSASYAFTAMDSSKYKSYLLYVYNLVTATNVQQIKARTSPDGTNFDSGSADYSWRLNVSGGSTSDTTADYARLAQSSSYNSNTGFSGIITILDPHNTSTETRVMFQYMNHFGGATGAPEVGDGAFLRVTAEASLGLQIFAASGNITSAKITAYGITNS